MVRAVEVMLSRIGRDRLEFLLLCRNYLAGVYI